MTRPRAKRARPNPPPAVLSVPEYPHIEFLDAAQRDRFVRLSQVHFAPSRFLDPFLLSRLGIASELEAFFEGTGLGPLFHMQELTYRDLTLEFISSFSFDSNNRTVSFRLRNQPYQLTLTDFATHIGVRTGGNPPPDFTPFPMWLSMAEDTRVDTSKLRMILIHDPRLRLWAKTCVHTIFAREGTDRLNCGELSMISARLNLERRDTPFHPDVPGLIAHHFAKIAVGTQTKSIGIGGIVTHLAHSVMGFDGTGGHPPMTSTVPLFDHDYMMKTQKWVRKQGTQYQWLWRKDGRTEFWMNLPRPLPSLMPLPPLGEGKPYSRPSYLFPLEIGESSQTGEARGRSAASAGPSGPSTSAQPTLLPVSEGPSRPPAAEGPASAGPPSPVAETRSVPTEPIPPRPPSPTHGMTTEPLRVPKTEPPTWIPVPRRPDPPRHTAPGFDPYSFENQRYIHDRINRNLEGYHAWTAHVLSGRALPGQPAPSYYRGPDKFPGAIFEEVGVDPDSWGPDWGEYYGGAGGQFLPHQWFRGGPGGPPEPGLEGEGTSRHRPRGETTSGAEPATAAVTPSRPASPRVPEQPIPTAPLGRDEVIVEDAATDDE